MIRKYNILASPWFLLGLVLLLANDHVFKQAYGNWLTGKLSDIAGLFIFPLFWIVLFPNRKKLIIWLTASLFTLWKSPFSDGFITSWNEAGLFPIQRTVDFTDLLALLMLPPAYHFENITDVRPLKIHPLWILAPCAFAFMATSFRTVENLDSLNKTYTLEMPLDTFLNRMDRMKTASYSFRKGDSTDIDTLDISSPFCAGSVTCVITEKTGNTTKLRLISGMHRCPSNKKNRDALVEEFEKVVLKQQ